MFCAILALAAAAALALPSPAPADSSPLPYATPAPVDGLTVADIRAKSRAASGADITVPHEIATWKTRIAGLDGSERRVSLGKDWLAVVRRGSISSASGLNNGTRWRRNANGQVLIAQREAPDPTLDPAAQRLTRVQSPVDAYVVETTAANGAVTRTYYDARTFLIVRRERDAFGVHSYSVYEDFVADAAGRTIARHQYGADQRPNSEWDERLESDDLTTPVSPQEVAIPPNARTLVEFPVGRSTVRLPARFVNGAIIVQVQIAGRGVDFILDSGASELVIDEGVATELGLDLQGRSTVTVAGNIPASTVRIPEMKVGDLVMHDVVVTTLPFTRNVEPGTKAAGLLGFDFFDGAAITIDYQKQTVDATEPSAFTPEDAAKPLDVRMNSGQPQVSLLIGSSTGDRFILDTGAQRATVVLFNHFVRRNAANIDASAKRGEGAHSRTMMIGGIVDNTQVVLREVTFGTWVLSNVRGLLAKSPPAFDNVDGLIGSDLLYNFRFTIDEPHSKIYLQPAGVVPSPSPRPSGK